MPARPFSRGIGRHAGFTLIELLVVLAIIALLSTLATPRYFQSIWASKETVLIKNLQITRDTIDKFYSDTGRYPQSLEELVEKKYLRSVPFDPITESSATWELIAPDDPDQGGVYELRSGASGSARDGTVFSAL